MPQVALVTGGAIRIGCAIALKLAQSGYAVAIQYNNSKDEARRTAEIIRAAGGVSECFRADLKEIAALEGLVSETEAAFGAISCLVNNASMFQDDSFQTMSPSGWDAHMAVNLRAPLFLAQAVASRLPAGTKGDIINLIDQRVLRPNPMFFSYTVAKSALWTATQTMAQALAPRLRVNAISPGPVLKSVHQTAEEFDHECASMPLGHGTTPEEIAGAALFILNAPAMTGQMITLDGGQHLLWQTPDLRVT